VSSAAHVNGEKNKRADLAEDQPSLFDYMAGQASFPVVVIAWCKPSPGLASNEDEETTLRTENSLRLAAGSFHEQ
jgi:hypothetical protein